ncbi:hypothetical protein [Roseiterribacter gracilis]|uniref:Uncharacterized protein n=1 Tax=Roseiterribacter gracilis TaxID=2812848 RepID=A0A8S8XB50_9PROT|nr:hypothetical protein TMPK1_13180 [Rhodospirillales bacterium TMPK1]
MSRDFSTLLHWMRRQARPLLLLLLLTQLAMVGHRIEHFVAPDQVESIADCAAFAPTPDASCEPPAVVRTPASFTLFAAWSPTEQIRAGEINQHAYRSQAPPA